MNPVAMAMLENKLAAPRIEPAIFMFSTLSDSGL